MEKGCSRSGRPPSSTVGLRVVEGKSYKKLDFDGSPSRLPGVSSGPRSDSPRTDGRGPGAESLPDLDSSLCFSLFTLRSVGLVSLYRGVSFTFCVRRT